MSKIFPKTILLFLFCTIGVASGAVDVVVEPDPLNIQNEISLTLIPGQAGRLAMAYNDLASNVALGIAYSADYGQTWSTKDLPLPTEPSGLMTMARGFDPSITADSSGRLYASFIADGATSNFGMPDSGLFVSTSTDYGANWSSPVIVSYDGPPTTLPPDPLYRYNDRDQITVDTFSTSSYQNNVYVSWIKDRGYYSPAQPLGDIYVSYSTNNGATFSSAQQINDSNVNHDMSNMPIPSVASDGTVYVSWLDYNCLTGGQGTIYLDKSTNGGANWGTDITVTTTPINLPPLNVKTGAGVSDALAKGAPVLATDPTNASTLYIAYAAMGTLVPGDDADIFLIKSTDYGVTWGSAVRVNSDSTSCDQILPWIEVKPDGTIDIAWYDRTADPNDALWDVVITKSTDGGSSFAPAVKLTDVSFATPSSLWMGEYLGLALDSSDAYVAFTSSTTDMNGDVLFDSIANSSIPEPGTWVLIIMAATSLLLKRKNG